MAFPSRVCRLLRSGQLITRSKDFYCGFVRPCVCRIVSNFETSKMWRRRPKLG